ncbi:DUF72 domain-containing protein [Acidovorax sp. SUPP2522]|uniref:DUF72 domain-containing protein n=1 Tax=unclassified Acidovorax TaxID=2684926 RepID=UPI00234A909D|nr:MULTISPECIES: DUF72 domain-containing protein [unclassified Acidovorax]WCM97606.1 DUF72 domain-containing protein [Acidovorax sp. GBBC 1281]GKT13170.1 DUF72 domain-containing protein [Acidovorax sp. SUPP2522]
MAAQIRIGVSGWRYAPWRGAFYPEDLVQAKELAFASHQFPAIELNGSFYALQRPSSYARWAADTPEGFVFTVKAPRYITHILRLREARAAVANFMASGLFALGAKLGPILWQLPPSLPFDAALLEEFLALLPHDTDAAATLAQAREERMHGRELLQPHRPWRLRHALEVRHASYCTPECIDLLRHHRVALVVADTGGRWPELGDVTADFLYLRLHGAQQLYASGYSDAQIAQWGERIRAWAHGQAPKGLETAAPPDTAPSRTERDVFCFFDNTMKIHAPENALRLARYLQLGTHLQAAPPRA